MKLVAPLLLVALAATAAPALFAQTAVFTDPANLRGERVRPRDDRELPIDQGAPGLQQALRKLSTRASLMLIVAHPDDEDGGMLTFYSRGLGARVAMLTLNRGEGGQNAMTGDFEDALGLLRTQELLAADRYLGVDQMFGTEVDFGFSKTKAESFDKWTHERVLYDAVRAIRLYRPLVLASVFIGGVTDGHGQHQVSGQICQEAFKAAGDPTVFPELTREGILPWQPLKVFARVPAQSITPRGLYDYATGQFVAASFTNYVTGEVSKTPPTPDIVVHEGTSDPLLTYASASPDDLQGHADPASQLTYIQFARIGLGLQKSQIGGNMRVPGPGAYDVAYHLYGSCVPSLSPSAAEHCHPERSDASRPPPTQLGQDNFFTDIDTSFESIATLAPSAPEWLPKELHILRVEVDEAAKWNADPATRAGVADLLADILKRVDILLPALDSSTASVDQKANALHELRVKRVQLSDALALALGVAVKADSDSDMVQAGTRVPVHLHLSASAAGAPIDFRLALKSSGAADETVPCPDPDDTQNAGAFRHLEHEVIRDCTTGASQPLELTRPYFSRPSIEQPFYDLNDPKLRNAPAAPPALVLLAEFRYHGAQFQVSTVVQRDLQPLQIVPPASVTAISHAQVLPREQASLRISLNVSPSNVRVEGEFPENWKVTPDVQPDHSPLGFKQLLLTVPFEDRKITTLHAVAVLPGKEVRHGYRSVGYGTLPVSNFYTPATIRIVPADVKLPAKHNIAYVPGTGDAVPEALTSIGLNPTLLTIADLDAEKLAKFDTVVLGVRTYAAHPDLHGAATRALLEYARNGGNVVVQYQTTEFTAEDAPYPLSLGSNEKVVDETAPVRLLARGSEPDHNLAFALLSTPNVITAADFDSWVEERGHGFLSSWDPHYTALLETHDPGAAAEGVQPQSPQRGGLITAPLGKGRWTYCAFALYRQLPEAIPGAFRLFANLLQP